MRGWNQKIFGSINQAITKTWNSSSLYEFSTILNTQNSNALIHTAAAPWPLFPFPSLRTLLRHRRPLAPFHGGSIKTSTLRTFATKTVAPKSANRSGSGRSGLARYLLLAPPLIAASLGKWQLDRRQWKTDLLERRQRIMKGEALDIFSDEMPEPEEYQRVRATGSFDYSRTQFIGPRPRSRMGTTEIGYLAVTPLVEERKGAKKSSSKSSPSPPREIMVMRGWVPAAWRDSPAARTAGEEPSGPVIIQGIVRFGEDPGTFVPDNKPEEGAWYYINSNELALAAGLPSGTPMVEVISPETDMRMLDGGPTVMDVLGGRGKLPSAPVEKYPLAKSEGDMGAFSVMPRDHLNYAATWFTLMAATGAMAVKALRKSKRV